MTAVCGACGAKSRDALLCPPCWAALARDLRAVPGLVTDLDTAAARMDRLTPPTPGGLASELNPVGWQAADVQTALLVTLTHWANQLFEPRWWRSGLPGSITARAAAALLSNPPAVRAHPAAAELADDIHGAVDRARRVIDKPDERPTVGACPTLTDNGDCGGPLHLDADTGSVTCDRCRRVFDRAELRHLGQMLTHSGPIDVFRAEWFTGVPASTIRRWVAEDRCPATKTAGRLMVLVADVVAARDGRRRATGAAS
jgi:hypothetical protein